MDEREGQYWDRDLAADLSYYGYNRAATFVFLDACFSCRVLPVSGRVGGGLNGPWVETDRVLRPRTTNRVSIPERTPNFEPPAMGITSLKRSLGPVATKQYPVLGGDFGGAGGGAPERIWGFHLLNERVRTGVRETVHAPPGLPGYDESINQHGAWTYTFLTQGLLTHRSEGGRLDLVGLFKEAYERYVTTHPNRGDRPCCFVHANGQHYNTNDPDVEAWQLPSGLVTAQQLFGLP